jgi:hypothetical protein
MKSFLPLLPLVLFTAATALAAEKAIALPNAGFEEKTASWINTSDHGMSVAVPEAARSGSLGLRVTDTSDTLGSSLASKRFPVTPGKTYQVRFQGRIVKGEGIAVYLRFNDAAGKALNSPELKNQINVAVRRADTQWKQFSAKGTAPATATQVDIWIHSFNKNSVTADFDDFELVELGS